MKKRASELSEQERIKTLDMLYTAASSISGRDAMKMFLRDLLTESERIMLGRRVWIARLLLQGLRPDDIAAQLKVSYTTIYKVERWLNDQMPGYEQALKGLEKEMDKRALKREMKENPFGYARLKKKYPLHFLFFPEPKPKKQYRD